MTTLAKRATPSQARIMRIVAGAVRNAVDAHPEWGAVDHRFAGSIAKRAAGTLTAQWPDVLAAMPSDSEGDDRVAPSPRCRSVAKRRKGGASYVGRRSPLAAAAREIGMLARQARIEGNTERLEGLADALRVIARQGGRP